jgi:hypothetical protein
MIMNKWQNSAVIVCLVVLIGLPVWIGSRARERHTSTTIRYYGGHAPQKVQHVLERLNNTIKEAKEIISAQSDKLIFIDRDGDIKEYSYIYNTLWNNDYPAIANIGHFYFEYRDGMGSLLTRSRGRLNIIQRVGYSIRLKVNEKQILAYSSIEVSPITMVRQPENCALLVYQ